MLRVSSVRLHHCLANYTYYRWQTKRGDIALIDAVQKFSSELEAEQWFIDQRWPDGLRCARCGSDRVRRQNTCRPMPFYCNPCRRYFSVKTGTVLECSNIPLSKWAIAIYLYSTSVKGVSSMKLHRDLGITLRSARHLAHRIRDMYWDGAVLGALGGRRDLHWRQGEERAQFRTSQA